MAFILPCCNTAQYKRLRRLLCHSCKLYRPCCKTAHRALQELFPRFDPFYCTRYQTDTTSHCTTCATLERITAPERPPAHTRYHNHAGRYTGQHSRPIIIRYIRGRRPCQPGGVSILPTPGGLRSGTGQQSGRSGSARRGQSNSRGAASGAEPLAALAAAFFGLSPDSQ